MKSLVLYCNYSKEKKEFEGKQEVDTCRLHDKNNVEFHINLWVEFFWYYEKFGSLL